MDNAIDYVEFKIRNKLEQFDLNKVDEKVKFVNTAIEIVNQLKTNSEKQIYLDIIKTLTGVPTDILSKDLKEQTQVVSQDTSEKIVYSEDAEIKAVKFVLASLCHKKEYANFDFDMEKYLINPTYIKLYSLMKQYHHKNENLLISTLFDVFEVEKEPNIQDIIDYSFAQITDAEEYYNECIWKIKENYLKNQIKNLSEDYKNITDSEKRLQTAKKINEMQLKLRNKVLED